MVARHPDVPRFVQDTPPSRFALARAWSKAQVWRWAVLDLLQHVLAVSDTLPSTLAWRVHPGASYYTPRSESFRVYRSRPAGPHTVRREESRAHPDRIWQNHC